MTGPRALLLLGVLAAAVAFRLAVLDGVAAHPRSFAPVVDSEAYLLQALRVADGDRLVDGVTFQAPLYPWLLGQLLRAGGVRGVSGAERASDLPPEVLARALALGRGLNFALGLALVLLLYALGRALFSPACGLWAALLAALSSPLAFHEAHLLKVSLAVLFLPAAVLAATRAFRMGRGRSWILVGLLLGLGGLVRGNMHLLVWGTAVLLPLAGWLTRRVSWSLRSVAGLLAGFALALAPVVLRNSLVAGRPVLVTAAGGTAFFLCNHAGNATGLVEHTSLNRQVPRHEEHDWRLAAEQALGRPLDPAGVSAYWMERALNDIRNDPARWLLVELRKLFLLASRYEAPDNVLVALGEDEIDVLRWTPSRWGIVLPLALAGLVLAWRTRGGMGDGGVRGGRAALLVAFLGYGATLLLFVVTSRFRSPIQPLAMIWAGHFLASVPDFWRARTHRAAQSGRWAVAAALLGGHALAQVSEGPLGPLSEVERGRHLAVALANRAAVARAEGDLPDARADLEAALAIAKRHGESAPGLCMERGALERDAAILAEQSASASAVAEARAAREAAEAWCRRALELDPGHAPTQRLLGMLAYDRGDFALAAASHGRALERVPGDVDARQYRCLARLALATGDPDEAQGALADARWLVAQRPDDDASHGLLALALLALGDEAQARRALDDYDRQAMAREAAGWPRRLPDQPPFQSLRGRP